jgi:hypothetical protein
MRVIGRIDLWPAIAMDRKADIFFVICFEGDQRS